MIPYHHIELPHKGGVAVAIGRGQVVPCEYVSTWNGRDLSAPEPNRRHAPKSNTAALPSDPEDMIREALAIQQMSVRQLRERYGVASGVFARVLARMVDRGELRVRWQKPSRSQAPVRVYRLAEDSSI